MVGNGINDARALAVTLAGMTIIFFAPRSA